MHKKTKKTSGWNRRWCHPVCSEREREREKNKVQKQPLHQLNARPCTGGNRQETSPRCPAAIGGGDVTVLAAVSLLTNTKICSPAWQRRVLFCLRLLIETRAGLQVHALLWESFSVFLNLIWKCSHYTYCLSSGKQVHVIHGAILTVTVQLMVHLMHLR